MSKYHIRDYEEGDEQAITILFNMVFGKSLTVSQWRWKYNGTRFQIIYAKVAFDEQNTLIGHAGAIPLWGFYSGDQIPFFQVCDVMIHPDHRGYLGSRNLFTRLLRDLLAGIFNRFPQAFCYGFPGRRPFLVGKQARVYEQIELATELTRQPRSSMLYLLNTKLLVWDDPRLDRLCLQLLPRYKLLLQRDRYYLQWRYRDNPFFSYQLIGFFILGKLKGWAVVRQENGRLLVIDILIAHRWLDFAIASLDRVAKQAGAHSVHIWLSSDLRKAKLGKPRTTDVVATHMIWGTLYSTDDVRQNFYYTMGELDIF